ncbi:MAG TPA: sugar phosphate nucleotidyltransferase [Candidatus Gastranaerophilales bacterium]|nr:sugar phosphate nucleotidyltransferase [Candidatus Gastranaerophilales bacterium]
MSKRAVILAGGKGARLRPYTVVLPKPLMPIGDYPVLEVIVKQLINCGFDYLTMAVNHQADIIKAFFGNGEKWNIKIDYALENKPLSTMGPLKLIDNLPENFIVMNGDILTDLNYSDFLEHHSKNQNAFTVSTFAKSLKSEYGILEINENNEIIHFQEKPFIKHTVSMGVYALNKKVLDLIPYNQSYGFDNIMYDFIRTGSFASAKNHNGYWLDIGNPNDYMLAIDLFENNKEIFLGETIL